MYFTVYRVTCLVNGKIYIGKHQTNDPDDEYMGSGKLIEAALEKHGVENFKKEILHVFDSEEEMEAKEAELVTEEFCARDDTYNLCPGGRGGWGYINSSGIAKFAGRRHTEETKQRISLKSRGNKGMLGRQLSPESRKKISDSWVKRRLRGEKRRKMSEETRKRISEALKGHKPSADARSKMSEGQKRRWQNVERSFTDQHRKNLSEAMKRWHSLRAKSLASNQES